MSEEKKTGLRLDDKVKAEDALIASMAHAGEGKIWAFTVAAAILIHAILLIINFPDVTTVLPKKPAKPAVVVKKFRPPPPKIERKKIEKKKFTKKVPIPDPTPDEPEPIREPEPEIDPEPIPPDVDILLGDPGPPPPTGPVHAGVGGVTEPRKIEESSVKPDFPEMARLARMEGKVVMQAVILADGTVADVNVLQCTRPGVGFEESATEAVKQWRYEPAMQDGRPVDVYFTVIVDFNLN